MAKAQDIKTHADDALIFAVIVALIAQRDEAQAALAKANKRISLLRAAYRLADG